MTESALDQALPTYPTCRDAVWHSGHGEAKSTPAKNEAEFMNFRDETQWALQKFGVGQPVRRSEDPKLVRGEGRYTDDVNLPAQAYAVMVRSERAHGIIRNIDASAASA